MPRSVHWYTASTDSSTLRAVPVDPLALETLRSLLTIGSIALGVRLRFRTKIPSIDKRLLAITRAEASLDELLVCAEDGLELGDRDVVKELAFAEGAVGDCESLLAISGFPDCQQSLESVI